MKCMTCGIEGHDSQGSKDLCLVAAAARCERMELQLRAMVEERDLYSDVVDAAKLWLKHHGEVSHSTYYLALKYQVERLGSKVTEKPKCGLCGGQDNHDGGCIPDTI
jgi:hypothetical protein